MCWARGWLATGLQFSYCSLKNIILYSRMRHPPTGEKFVCRWPGHGDWKSHDCYVFVYLLFELHETLITCRCISQLCINSILKAIAPKRKLIPIDYVGYEQFRKTTPRSRFTQYLFLLHRFFLHVLFSRLLLFFFCFVFFTLRGKNDAIKLNVSKYRTRVQNNTKDISKQEKEFIT